jgi:hypothetical protein
MDTSEHQVLANPPASGTRRALLRASLDGFALAASGIFLPTGDAHDAAAREGAYGGRLGGRHGKDRRGRDPRKRRDKDTRRGKKNDRQNDDPPPGRGLFRNTALTVYSGNGPFTFTFYYRIKTGLDDYGPWIHHTTQTPIPGFSHRYAPDRFRVGVLISAPEGMGDGQAFFDARNLAFGAPRASVNAGFGLDPTRNRLGNTLIAEQAFAVPLNPSGDPSAMVSRRYRTSIEENRFASLRLIRTADSDDAIEFSVEAYA